MGKQHLVVVTMVIYSNDYEFISELGTLDEANGRNGLIPEYPSETYYYMIKDAFPCIPRYLRGTPLSDFEIQMSRPWTVVALLFLFFVEVSAHNSKEAFFAVQFYEKYIEVEAEFPQTLRNALIDIAPELNNATHTTI